MVSSVVEEFGPRLVALRQCGLVEFADRVAQYHHDADNARRCEREATRAAIAFVVGPQQGATVRDTYILLRASHSEALARAAELLSLHTARLSLDLLDATDRGGMSPADVGLPPEDLDDVLRRAQEALARCKEIGAQIEKLGRNDGDGNEADADQRLLAGLAALHGNSVDQYLNAVETRGSPVQLSLAKLLMRGTTSGSITSVPARRPLARS